MSPRNEAGNGRPLDPGHEPGAAMALISRAPGCNFSHNVPRAWMLTAGFAVLLLVAGCGASTGPANSRIAFVSSRVVTSRGGAVELYVMNADGTGQRRLTRNDAIGYLSDYSPFDAAPSWAPDGKWIAYEHDDPAKEKPDIDIVRADGTGRRVLVRNASFPAWSPKGDLIAFTRERTGGADVWVIRPDGTGVRVLFHNAAFSAWSPNGERVAYTRLSGKGADIYAAKLDGSDELRVTTSPAPDFLPAWSTQDEIAFVRQTETGSDDIYVIDADGTHERRLTRSLAQDTSPAWSPDGSQIAFSNDLTFTKEWRSGEEIFVINADGSGRRRLTHNKVRDIAPSWEPSG